MLVRFKRVHFAALKDGTWGLKFSDPDGEVIVPVPGTPIDVPKKDGTTRNLKVGEVVWTSEDKHEVLTKIDGKSSKVHRKPRFPDKKYNPHGEPRKPDPTTTKMSAAGFKLRETDTHSVLEITDINGNILEVWMSKSRQEDLFEAVFNE